MNEQRRRRHSSFRHSTFWHYRKIYTAPQLKGAYNTSTVSVRTHFFNDTKGASPVMVLAFLVFIAGLASWGALIGVKYLTQQSVDGLKADISKFNEEFRSTAVQDMIRSARGLGAANAILKDHHIVTPVFTALEEQTLPNVRYTSFAYDGSTGRVTLGASAANERVFAEQLATLRTVPIFQTLEFGNPSLRVGGAIDFSMTLAVRKSDRYPFMAQP